MSEKLTDIIHPDFFVHEKSSTILARLCRPDHEPTDAEIATLVVQYLWRYHRKGANDGSLGSITGLMYFMEYYFAHIRFRGARFDFSRLDSVMVPIFDFLEKHGYAVSMLGDVSSTTAIVRSIILEKLNCAKGAPFQGLDIGTGSGILSLAQYILARRSGLSSIRIDGIEQNVSVARQAESTLRSFVPGGIFHIHAADATKDYAYKKIPNRPHFVSVEMIPFSGSDMIIQNQDISGSNISPDPFFPVLFALSRKFAHLVEITCFPRAMRKLVQLSKDSVLGIVDLSLSDEDGLLHLASITSQESLDNHVGNISTQGIQLSADSEFIPLADVGSHLLSLPGNSGGFIKPFFVWRYRWRKLLEYNSQYKNLLYLFQSASEEQKKRMAVMPPLVWRDTVTH